MKGPLFYAKILLFGEYGIIKDAKGLSIPYNFYKGALKISDTKNHEAKASNQKLSEFADYLEQINRTLVTFNTKQLREDLAKGLYFDSSIPQGYGIGSSGALVAAVYDCYANNKITILENLTRDKLLKLKQIFGVKFLSGVNNRDLTSFRVSLDRTWTLVCVLLGLFVSWILKEKRFYPFVPNAKHLNAYSICLKQENL